MFYLHIFFLPAVEFKSGKTVEVINIFNNTNFLR